MRHAQLALALCCGTSLFAVALTQRAAACSWVTPDCRRARPFPRSGAMVPASVPAVGVMFGSLWPEFSIELRNAEGSLVEGTVEQPEGFGLLRFVPAAPLAADEDYELRYSEPCEEGDSDSGVGTATAKFHTGAAVALPTSLGALSVRDYQYADLSGDLDYTTCLAESVRAVIASLELELEPEVEAYLPVTRFETTLDGQLWSASAHGKFATPSYSNARGPTSRDVSWIFAECDGAVHQGTKLGKHTVEVRALIEGAPELALTASTDIELACGQAVSIDDAGSDGAAVSEADRGCSTGRSPPRAWALIAAALALSTVRRWRKTARV